MVFWHDDFTEVIEVADVAPNHVPVEKPCRRQRLVLSRSADLLTAKSIEHR